MDIKQKLERPFPQNSLHWRTGATTKDKQKGIALAYIDARDAMKRLDDVVGFEGWQCRYSHSGDGVVICEIGLRLNNEWLWRANGAGDTQVEAEKGRLSDAFKRAAVMWGVGRYLYKLPNVWVPIDQYKRIAETPKLPNWATPEGYDEIMAKKEAV